MGITDVDGLKMGWAKAQKGCRNLCIPSTVLPAGFYQCLVESNTYRIMLSVYALAAIFYSNSFLGHEFQ